MLCALLARYTVYVIGVLQVNKVILNQLKEQFLSCAPSLLTRYAAFSRSAVSNSTKKLEFDHQDVCAVIMAALNTGQYIQGESLLFLPGYVIL